MILTESTIHVLQTALGFGAIASIVSFLWAPVLIAFLYKYNIIRNPEYDASLAMGARKSKAGVPVMGGLLVIVTVAAITMIFNWERSFTWVPIGVMLLSATLGGVDDLLNIFNQKI